ncbi:amino acid ABC transporter permease [Paenibacillus cremeus]|uniref:Amino acid ABC transporter permease n=1 Tax=Paenibacillus cremeus TaxID=2163881 RepID=A0A559KGA2_9BACL|nr:amino acid ABC transporter permease [Paenibacillus cremeus]TVY11146.1 amino acid ABC transporter permease [Paenibacillus cremeus]
MIALGGGLDLNWGKAFASLPFMLEGLRITIYIAVFGLLFGYILGLAAGIARTTSIKVLNYIAMVYIEAIRGTPILVQAVWLYFGFNQLLMQWAGWRVTENIAGIIVIAVNAGAYIAEIVRGSIQSIEKGQQEAGRSLGLTAVQTFIHIIFPQALKRMIPPLGNQFIISLKDTSLLSVIAVGELLRNSQEIVANDFNAFEIYTLLAALYFLLTLMLTLCLRWIERKLGARL